MYPATSPQLPEILILLAAAVLVVPLFNRLRLGSVLGYLAAGVLVGPWGLGAISDFTHIRHIAEFGVVFLLFVIGIELRPDRLWSMRRLVFGLGTAQVLLTGLALAGIALALRQPAETALIAGFGLALSSTAFGMQILSDRAELESRHGRAAFSVLLLQDLSVVPLLALVALLAADAPLETGVEFALLDAALILLAVILGGRFLLSPLLQSVAAARKRELFTAAALFVVLGIAWLVEQAGLSLALGAFVAGLLLADSQFRHEVVADIEPFRGILLGLFFMSVGMSVDLGLLASHPALIAALVGGLLLTKVVVLWPLARGLAVDAAGATRVAALLSQSGEFGFVLFGLAAGTGVMAQDVLQILVVVIALSMMATPGMVWLADRLARRDARVQHFREPDSGHLAEGGQHVVIAGFGRVGHRVARLLQRAGVPWVAIDRDPERVSAAHAEGDNVFYGDASHVDVLRSVDAAHAAAVVCTLDQVAASVRLVGLLRRRYPDLVIHARGRDRQHCEQLLEAGATAAVSENFEASMQLGAAALRSAGMDQERATEIVAAMRAEYYR